MPPEDDKRPLPSVDEINAYLELSAARTKKRLPLAFGSTGAPKAPAKERKLRVAAPKADVTAKGEAAPLEPALDAATPSTKPSGS
jgi:hypothetical protein